MTVAEGATAGSPSTRRIRLRDGGLLALLVALFLLPWWNSNFGGTLEGNSPFYGLLLLHGEAPYRDFYLHLPPLAVIESAAIDAVAGERTLIAHRLVGGLERIAFALVLFFWLARAFPREAAFLGAFAAIVAASGDGTDVLYLYNYQSLFWATLAGWMGAMALDSEELRVLPWLASGAASGLCLLMKQSTGVGVAAALAGALALVSYRRFGVPGALRRGAFWSAGFALALAPVVVWLWMRGALGDAFDQIFLDATGKKGPIADLLARALETTFTTRAFAVPATLAILLLAVLTPAILARGAGSADGSPGMDGSWPRGSLWSRALACSLACGAAIPLSRLAHPGIGWLRLPQRTGLYLALFGCAWVAAHDAFAAVRRRLSAAETERLLLATVGFATAYMLSLSWAASEAMAAPGLGLVVAGAATSGTGIRGRATAANRLTRGWLEPLVLAGVLALALGVSWQRRVEPFWFAGWTEPPLDAPRAASPPRGLAGFEISAETSHFIERLVAAIEGHSQPSDRIFVFSSAPVFYFLTGRQVETFASLHWYDVTTDDICRRDLARLLENPPAVLVLWEESEQELRLHEQVFRAGRPSGQREMSRGLRDLAAKRYSEVDALVAPGGAEVKVFALALPP